MSVNGGPEKSKTVPRCQSDPTQANSLHLQTQWEDRYPLNVSPSEIYQVALWANNSCENRVGWQKLSTPVSSSFGGCNFQELAMFNQLWIPLSPGASFTGWTKINTITFWNSLSLTDPVCGKPRSHKGLCPLFLFLCRGDVCGCLLHGKQGPGSFVFSETEEHSLSSLARHQVSSQTDEICHTHDFRTQGWQQCWLSFVRFNLHSNYSLINTGSMCPEEQNGWVCVSVSSHISVSL